MTKRFSKQKTLLEQIFNEMFVNLEKEKEFDEVLIQRLQNLAENNSLSNTVKVVEAIKLSVG